MSSRLIDSLTTTDALADVFDDSTLLGAMLEFEAALARVEARLDMIPEAAARVIGVAAAQLDRFDATAIGRAARASGTIAVPLVAALNERVRAIDASAARFVHFGATSQDVVDTAIVLALKRARTVLDRDQARLASMLRGLSDEHAATVMLGRTLLQASPPVTFGLKVAGWLGAMRRTAQHVTASFDAALVLQCGGAVGTLASFGTKGPDVAQLLAAELGLAVADAPFHAHRDRLGALVTACGLHTAALGKTARDISLLMQNEIGEVAERGGGSSTLVHKRNPAGCAIVLAAATRMPGLVAAFLGSMVQEHERGVGGWHAEAPLVAGVVQTTGAALAALTGVFEHLTVFPVRMRENLERTNGVVFSERVMLQLAPVLGQDEAQRLVGDAVARSRQGAGRFGEIVRATPAIANALPADVLATVDAPEAYLGAAERLRRALLSESR